MARVKLTECDRESAGEVEVSKFTYLSLLVLDANELCGECVARSGDLAQLCCKQGQGMVIRAAGLGLETEGAEEGRAALNVGFVLCLCSFLAFSESLGLAD